jgi:hypothetical protein
MTESQEAACWMVLMEAGLAHVPEIVRWADEKIIASEKPHPALIEISTSQEDAFHPVFDQLKQLRRDVDRFDALRYAAPSIRAAIEEGRIRADSVATFTYTYLCGDFFQIPDDMCFLYSADDDFYLAVVEGRGSRELVEQEFVAALKSVERA